MQDLRFLVFLLEGIAAFAGIYFYRNNPGNKAAGMFAYFLLITYVVEAIGFFPAMIYWNESIHFLKDGFFYKNFWLYNPYIILSFVVYLTFFRKNIRNKKTSDFLKKLIIIYAFACILFLVFTDVFFRTTSTFTYLTGSVLLLAVIFYYYFEILLSNRILNIKRDISFYISLGAVVHFLTTTPIFIYFNYFTNKSPEFIQLSSAVMIAMNIFMYSTYSFGFFFLSHKAIGKKKLAKDTNTGQ
ncbi:hypothetical protein FHG64_15770 [Antarcticibacterium flavum]|uniref:Histidine kinase N-terminal 7TM region domain-containing protein n=1 Tax=Antarcticibacterium flavum TaxID=2058175 RepID=A0A5B7X7W8_9FLAO|nr:MULTISPECIES: hypothetical protein [Antarcticibacterium]MCM4159806.1 hypothetical protein [Antarcticibacterium sp. W02-3]QCY70731.1 hypothetical protein FHG64_15770 [Antarcticibacterium flavum]